VVSTLIKIGISAYTSAIAALGGGIELGDLPDGNYIVDSNGAYIIGGADVLIVDGT
jgi:hypothetical protein